jgi:hypothetical protein
MHVPSIQFVVVHAKNRPLASHFEKRIEQNTANFALLPLSHEAHTLRQPQFTAVAEIIPQVQYCRKQMLVRISFWLEVPGTPNFSRISH